jgi:hypothetical protein
MRDESRYRLAVMANREAGVLSQMFRFGIHRSIVETTPVLQSLRPVAWSLVPRWLIGQSSATYGRRRPPRRGGDPAPNRTWRRPSRRKKPYESAA